MRAVSTTVKTARSEAASHADKLAELRAFLESGRAWPGEPRPECIETHASLVYLTRNSAWKLKKPVRLVHVDQQSLKNRTHLCREELRLNRELSGDLYRGLTPIVRRPDGSLVLGAEGSIVDWLIESRRLPASEMLDVRLVDGPPPQCSEVKAFCDVLAEFYRRQPKSPDAGEVFYRRLVSDSEIAAAHLREMASKTMVPVPEQTLGFAAKALEACCIEMIERGRQGLIVEGHGDLRTQHVCLIRPPVVFDRLEIDHGIRLLDPFYEINGLGLECSLMGSGWIRSVLLAELSQTMIHPSRELLFAYGVVAFLTRARIAADHFRDAEVTTPEKWRAKTKQNVDAAVHLVAQARSN